jgi:hypothetical protein
MEPADAVAAIARLIERPRRELTIPPMSGIFARMVNCVPGLLGFCYPALQFFGARNILKYRKHNSIINAIGTSYETSGRDSQ